MAIVRSPAAVANVAVRTARGLVLLLGAAIVVWLIQGPTAGVSTIAPTVTAPAPPDAPAVLSVLPVATPTLQAALAPAGTSAGDPLNAEGRRVPAMTTLPPSQSPRTSAPLPGLDVPPSAMVMNDAQRQTRDSVERSGQERVVWPQVRRAPPPTTAKSKQAQKAWHSVMRCLCHQKLIPT